MQAHPPASSRLGPQTGGAEFARRTQRAIELESLTLLVASLARPGSAHANQPVGRLSGGTGAGHALQVDVKSFVRKEPPIWPAGHLGYQSAPGLAFQSSAENWSALAEKLRACTSLRVFPGPAIPIQRIPSIAWRNSWTAVPAALVPYLDCGARRTHAACVTPRFHTS